MKNLLVASFMFLFTANPVSASHYLDSLSRIYNSAKTDTVKYNVLFKIVKERLETGSENFDPEAISGLLEKTIDELRIKNDLRRFESFLHLKGLYFFIKKQYELSNRYCDTCIYLTKKSGDYNELGSLYMLQEMNYHLLNLSERRVKVLYQAIESYGKAGSLEGQASACFTLGNIYFANKNHNLAIQAFLQGAEIRNKLQDSIGAGINYLFCAAVLMKDGNLKLAGEYISKGHPVIYSHVVYQPLYYYIINGRWLKAMNRNEEALHYLETGANLAVNGNQRYQRPMALCEMAEI